MTITDKDIYDHLEHFGIRGMHWGVRSTRAPGVSARTDREARKDAQEHARAKQFYGEGAGTRRKLIKAKVEGKSKNNPDYKKAFDHHSAQQDTSEHASKAQSERKRKDVTKKTKQGAGSVARRVTGEWGTTAAFTALAAGGVAFLASPKGRQIMKNNSTKIKNIVDSRKSQKTVKYINDFLKNS